GGSTGVGGGTIFQPGDPGKGDVEFKIRADQDVHPISSLIYGLNGDIDFKGANKGIGMTRMGGNRLTAYNWETNASNAGSDWQYSKDNYLSSSKTPGEAVRVPTQAALDNGAAMLLTVPIAGYVSADEVGPLDSNASPVNNPHFHKTIARKGSA